MIFQISPKRSVVRDLPQTYRQTVPQTRPCNSKASVCCGFFLKAGGRSKVMWKEVWWLLKMWQVCV